MPFDLPYFDLHYMAVAFLFAIYPKVVAVIRNGFVASSCINGKIVVLLFLTVTTTNIDIM